MTSAPTSPTADSYDFSSGQLTGLTTDPAWQEETIEIEVTDTQNLYYTHTFNVVEDVFGGDQTITSIGNPVASINFTNNIQSDNFRSGGNGWRLERDTGNIEANDGSFRGNVRSFDYDGEDEADVITISGFPVVTQLRYRRCYRFRSVRTRIEWTICNYLLCR